MRLNDSSCTSDPGLTTHVHRRGGRRVSAAPGVDEPQPPQPVFSLPPTPSTPPPSQGGPTLQALLGMLMGALQHPGVQQLLGSLLGGVLQGARLGAPCVEPVAKSMGESTASLAGQPPPSVFTPPSLGPSLSSALGGLLSPQALSALLGALQNPGVQRLLGLALDALRPGASQLASTSGSIYDATLAEPNQATSEISTNEMRRIVDQGGAAVFDGRTALEYSLGHLPGAINVAPKPGVAMSQYVSDVAEIERHVASRATPIILYCNGPFCGKSRRLGAELVNAGFTDVRRYQLGTPVWRALVGIMAIEPAGINHVLHGDRTAALIDARASSEFAAGSLPRARNVPVSEVIGAKDDGRLPMDDFNTRVIVFGRDRDQAETLAETLVGQGFNNVKYYAGPLSDLLGRVS